MVNKFREHKISNKMQFIMWFSGLRGAISYALSLHADFTSDETRRVIITTTLIIVLFTTVFFGGSTMPLLKYMRAGKKGSRRSSRRGQHRREVSISLSKTREWGQAIDSEHLSELTEEEDVAFSSARIVGFAKIDRRYLTPFFTRRFTTQELHDCKSQMAVLTDKWYQAIRVSPEHTDDEEGEESSQSVGVAGGSGMNSSQSTLVMLDDPLGGSGGRSEGNDDGEEDDRDTTALVRGGGGTRENGRSSTTKLFNSNRGRSYNTNA